MNKHTFKQARLALGKTQQQLANALNASVRQVARWESGEVAVPDDMPERLENLNRYSGEVDLTRVSTDALFKELQSRFTAMEAFHPKSQGFTRGRRLKAVASNMTEHGD